MRYRHTDTDIVRSARQQDFIRQAKDQYGQANLIANRDTLLRIFGKHTQTDPDLHSTDGLINLFNLVAFSDAHSIREVHFPADSAALHAAVAVLRGRRSGGRGERRLPNSWLRAEPPRRGRQAGAGPQHPSCPRAAAHDRRPDAGRHRRATQVSALAIPACPCTCPS